MVARRLRLSRSLIQAVSKADNSDYLKSDSATIPLMLLQTTASHLPNGAPIYITLQQPPGMPEWEKTLLSAAIGGIAALAVGLLKDAYDRYRKKKSIATQLGAELMNTLSKMESAQRMLMNEEFAHVDLVGRADMAWTAIHPIRTGSFDGYTETERAIVSEIDEGGLLQRFYDPVKLLWPSIIDDRGKGHAGAWATRLMMFVNVSVIGGREYVAKHKLKYIPRGPSPLEDMIRQRPGDAAAP